MQKCCHPETGGASPPSLQHALARQLVAPATPAAALAVEAPSLLTALPTAMLLVDYASRGNTTPTTWPNALLKRLPRVVLERSVGLRAVLAHGAVLRDFLVRRLPASHPAGSSWRALRDELASLTRDEVLSLLEAGIDSNLQYLQQHDLSLPAAGRDLYAESVGATGARRLLTRARVVLISWGVTESETIAREVCDPASLQASLLEFLTLVWDRGFEDLWREALPRLSEAARSAPPPKGSLTGSRWIAEVTGLWPADDYAIAADRAAGVCCVPCPAMGRSLSLFEIDGTAYVLYEPLEDGGAAAPREPTVALIDLAPLVDHMEALADRTRFKVMLSLARHQEQSMQELAGDLAIHTSTVSRHLGVLARAGLVTEVRGRGPRRYRLDRKRVRALCRTIVEALG